MDTMPCEHMSLETLEEGIMFGLMLGHTYLSHEAATERRSRALNTSRTTGLYRDKVIYTHSYAQNHIKASEGYGKKVTEEKECCAQDQTAAMANHRDRRKYRRTAHKERVRTCSNQPGLLGPKALHVLRGLGHSRDESNRRRRHNENPAPRQGKVKSQEDLEDRYLPEPLCHMEELRALIRTYSQATQRDYEQNQAGYDATALAQMIQTTTVTSEEDNDQLSSTCTKFFGENFQMCLEYPAQNRLIIGYPLICGHYSNTTIRFGRQGTLGARDRAREATGRATK